MENEKIRKLLKTIQELVDTPGLWSAKQQLVLEEISDDEKLALQEFSSWFAET